MMFVDFKNYLKKEQGLRRVIYRNSEGESVLMVMALRHCVGEN